MTRAQRVPASVKPSSDAAAVTTTPQRVGERVERIARRIRTWRNAAGLSLHALAKRSDVSPSTIHKIENGQTVPTIAVLLKLVDGLGRRPTDLLEEEGNVSGAALSRARAGPRLVTRRGLQIEWLTGHATSPEIEVWRITHPSGYSFGGQRVEHLSGDVVLHVESGALEVCVANETFDMATGDTLHFRGTQPHGWRNTAPGETTCLLTGHVQPGSQSGLVERMRALRNGSPKWQATSCKDSSPR